MTHFDGVAVVWLEGVAVAVECVGFRKFVAINVDGIRIKVVSSRSYLNIVS